MSGYTKLFESILDSTIWGESAETRIVWITMLAMRNKSHRVEASLPGLAHRARVKLEDAEKAVKKFLGPDKFSRSKEHDGRRIEAVDGGWLILNGEKYRAKLNEAERREYQRVKQGEYRKRRKVLKVGAQCEGARDAIADGMADFRE
jgi:hypothetical protein